MNAFAIVGIVLISLILLIAVLLILPAGVSARSDKNGNIICRLHYAFIRYRVYPAKEKKEKRRGKRAKMKDTSAPPAEKKRSIKDIISAVREFSSLIKSALSEAGNLLKKTTVRRLRAKVIIADGDDSAGAAFIYGGVCAVIYPLLGLLHSELKFAPRAENVDIRCDFEKEKTEFMLDLKLTAPLFRIMAAGWRLLKEYMNRA